MPSHTESCCPLLGDGRLLREIGSSYLNRSPGESTSEILSAAILSDSDISTHLPEAILRDRLVQQVQQDFAQERTVLLHGWILSQTEARRCALFFILHS
jgi:hypothetical protein